MAEGADREDRTEEPTQRRLDQATERGDVPKSAELPVFLSLGALTLSLAVAAGSAARTLAGNMAGYLANPHLVPDDGAALFDAGRRALLSAGFAVLAPIGLAMTAGLAAGLLQHKPLWTFEPLMPKFSRLSPAAGFARMFGRAALGQFAKSIAKLGIVGTLAGYLLWQERDRAEQLVGLAPADILPAILSLALRFLTGILAFYGLVAIADFAFTRFSWLRRQRMSKQEVKEEAKEQDGNPEIKAKIRQLRAQRVRKRMMAAVPKATVVIANPTHYAVALSYEAGMRAPVCVAKGIDALAQRIRAVASEHNVPVIENPPLARALHASIEIDGEIPVEHYKAVAEVIGFVLRLKRRAS